MLLSRDQFRDAVFKRDQYKCVFCGEPAKDAHHILERRLFSNGGYFLNNGASVCELHHIQCEMTVISVEQVREACGITKKVIPEHLYEDTIYDKWGNTILPDGRRMCGELFSDESVQKILERGGVLDQFIHYYKYPRTYHLPWSPGCTDDDKIISDLSQFENIDVVITEKMDGESTSLYHDYIHARSIDGRNHWSRDWVKNFHSKIQYDIPEGYRICGENLYAKHSISYKSLDSYFYGFSMWKGDECLSWDETLEYFELIGIKHVPVLYSGLFNKQHLLDIERNLDLTQTEGYVIRNSSNFRLRNFKENVAKFVRKNHINPANHHWMFTNTETNKLK